jgi:hypothetical protein
MYHTIAPANRHTKLIYCHGAVANRNTKLIRYTIAPANRHTELIYCRGASANRHTKLIYCHGANVQDITKLIRVAGAIANRNDGFLPVFVAGMFIPAGLFALKIAGKYYLCTCVTSGCKHEENKESQRRAKVFVMVQSLSLCAFVLNQKQYVENQNSLFLQELRQRIIQMGWALPGVRRMEYLH